MRCKPITRPIDSISVLLPTWQAMEFLERVFDALETQECSLPWDVHVIDSGSKDGTPEYLESRAAGFPVPLRVSRIPQGEFDHGDTRNQLAAFSKGELLVLLTQDAIPSRPDWLASLARNFEDPQVGGAYCRNVPRSDAQLLTRVFSFSDPGYSPRRTESRMPKQEEFASLSSDELRLLYSFNDVASAIRRELWERHPFPRTMMGEDLLMGRGLLHGGYSIVYDAHATVDHSHDYGPEKMRWRGQVDAGFNAEWLNRVCVPSFEDVRRMTGFAVDRDISILRTEFGLSSREAEEHRGEAAALRGALFQGMYEGGLSNVRYPTSAMRESAEVGLWMVLGSGCSEGDQTLMSKLAHALRVRGHCVDVFLLDEDGMLGGRSKGKRLSGQPTESKPSLQIFMERLKRQAPDVLHVHHLQGIEHGLMELAMDAGVPVIVSKMEAQSIGAESRKASIGENTSMPSSGEGAEAHSLLPQADLCLLRSTAEEEALRHSDRFDPTRLVHSLLGKAEPEMGEMDEQGLDDMAVELEFRYRALSCVGHFGFVRRAPMLDCAGISANRKKGRTEEQDAECLLLRPRAKAEYELRRVCEGRVRIEIDQLQIGTESHIRLGGVVTAGRKRLGRFAAALPKAGSESRVVSEVLVTILPPGTKTLTIATPYRFLWGRSYLRIQRVRVTHLQ